MTPSRRPRTGRREPEVPTGAPGRDARDHLGAERGRQGHDHRRAARRGRTTRDYHYVVTCTTRAPRPGEVDGVDYHFLDADDVRRAARRPGELPRGERGPRQLVRHAARPGPRGARRRAATSSSRSTSRAPRWSRSKVPGALLIFLVPPSLEDLFQRLRSRGHRDRRRARAAPAERRHRARPPGGLRLRRDQRDRPGRADGRADRRRSSPTSTAGTPTGGSWSTRGRLDPAARGHPGGGVADRSGGGGGRLARRRGRRRRRGARRRPDVHLPRARMRSADLEPGEAVLVEFGRRQALGIVVGRGRRARRRAEPSRSSTGSGPTDRCCRALTLALAGGIADHYLAPPALVLRAMLPPGLLERLELVAELTPAGAAAGDATPAGGRRPPLARRRPPRRSSRAVRARSATWPARTGAPACSAACASLEADGRVSLDWTLLGAGAGPRYERWIRLTDAGRERRSRRRRRAGSGSPGRPLGPRQVDVARGARRRHRPGGLPAAELAGRHGTDGRRRPRPPRPGRGRGPRATAAAAGHATGRPARRPARRERPAARPGRGGRPDPRGRSPPATRAAPARRRDRRRQDRDLRRGDRRVARGRPAGPRARPGDRAGPAARRSAAGRPRRPRRARPFRARGRRARRRVAADPGRRGRHRGRDAAGGRRAARRRRA